MNARDAVNLWYLGQMGREYAAEMATYPCEENSHSYRRRSSVTSRFRALAYTRRITGWHFAMWTLEGEFVSAIDGDLLRICHQQDFPGGHVVEVHFDALLCGGQRKALMNGRLQIGCQKGLRL